MNGNDNLGTIYIYNAEVQGNNNDFVVSMSTKDGTACKDIPDAVYDKDSSRVIWTSNSTSMAAECLLMPNIESIVLTKKS